MSENKTPRLAEVLGVEVGEKFGCLWVSHKTFHVDKDGDLCDEEGIPRPTVAVDMINHPEIVQRRPRWTEQEVEDAKAIQRLMPRYTYIGRNDDELWLVNRYGETDILAFELFPSLKPGQTVKLTNIIGGNE